MSGPGLFADLDKNVTDLLNENFPLKPKLEFTSPVTANGVNLQVTGVRNPDNSVFGTVVPKWTYAPWGLVAKGTIDTAHTFKADLAVNDKVAKGLKTQLVGTIGTAPSAKFGLEFRNQSVGATSSFLYTPGKASLLGASAAVLVNRFITGAAVDYSIGDISELKTAKGALYYKDRDFAVGGLVRTNGDEVSVGSNYYQAIGTTTAVGAELIYDLKKSNLNVTVGVRHRLDNDVTLKARADSAGKAALSVQSRVNRHVDVTLGGEVDVQGLNNGKDNKFGFTVSLTP